MEIREHYISSFFFHLIAILLVAAVSQSQLKTPPALTVMLSSDTDGMSEISGKVIAGEKHESAVPAPPAAPETTLAVKDETTVKPDEEKPAQVSRPEMKNEPLHTAATGAVGHESDQMRLARIHHGFFTQALVYAKGASQSFQLALRKEIESDLSGALSEGAAEITLFFNEEGGLGEVWGASNSEKLKAVLDKFDWRSFSQQNDYKVRLKGLRVKIQINRGEPSFSFAALSL